MSLIEFRGQIININEISRVYTMQKEWPTRYYIVVSFKNGEKTHFEFINSILFEAYCNILESKCKEK